MQGWRRILWSLALAAPVTAAFYLMCTHWVAVPWWDEWLTPGETLAAWYRGSLHFADLWGQHNESRKFFPRLLYLALYVPAGWDVRFGMLLTFAWVCVGAFGLYVLLRMTVAPPHVAGGFFFVLLLLFSPREYENFLYGIQGEAFTPAIALILALICNLRARSFCSKTIVSASLAFLSTYSFANGMLVWMLAFPVHWQGIAPESSARRRACRIVYLLVAFISIAAYFVGYRHPARSPALLAKLSLPPDALHYFTIWLGDLFLTPAPALVGWGVLILFATLAAAAVARRSRQPDSWRVLYPWLMLGIYALISGVITTAGRLGLGLIEAYDVRYTAFTVFFYIALVGLFCSLRRTKAITLPAAIIVLVAWVFTFFQELPQLNETKAEREHLRLVTRWSLAIPSNPDLQLLSPFPGTLRTIRILAKHDELRPRLVSESLVDVVAHAPAASTNAGFLDQIAFISRDRLRVQGWARIPNRNIPASYVVLGYLDETRRWKLFGVTETGVPRPDVASALKSQRLRTAGFDRTFAIGGFSAGNVRFRAWAIDAKRRRAFPISGTPVTARPQE